MTWKTKAVKHAEECMPQESCGLLAIIKGEKTYWPCKNISESGFEYFAIDPDDWAECEDTGEIIGVVHSHPNDPAIPSDNDKASCEHLELPFYIYSCFTKDWITFEPSGWKAPSLIGRCFIWGKHDCWAVVTDWFKETKNIEIPYWNRPKTLKDFLEKPEFEYALPKLKFIKQKTLDDIQIGDVLLFQTVTKKLDHVAVYIGDNMILNHHIRRLSCREPLDFSIQNALRSVYRYAP